MKICHINMKILDNVSFFSGGIMEGIPDIRKQLPLGVFGSRNPPVNVG